MNSRFRFDIVYLSLIIFIFLVSIFKQVFHQEEFINSLYQSILLPGEYIEIVAVVNPFILGVVLLIALYSKTRYVGLYLSIILMFSYSVYLILLLVSSDYQPCSCAGVFEFLSIKQHIIFNSVVFFVGLFTLINWKNL